MKDQSSFSWFQLHSKYMHVTERQMKSSFNWFQLHSKVVLILHATFLLDLIQYMSLPNIIKLSQTVWELWPAPDFSFRGDKYIMKIVKFVSLAIHLLVLLFIPNKYESNPLKNKGNISLWKKVKQKVNLE